MTPARIDLYRRLIDTHRRNDDPLIVVNREELSALLDCWQRCALVDVMDQGVQAARKPRYRVKARLTEPELME